MRRRTTASSGRRASKPAGLSPKQLADVPDDRLVERILKYTGRILRRDLGKDYTRGYVQFKAGYLPKGFLIVWVTAEVDFQVCNGGFGQFFWNQSRHFAGGAASALRTIGGGRFAAIVEKAIALNTAHQARLDALRKTDDWHTYNHLTYDVFESVDTAFYKCWDTMRIGRLQVRWVRRNPDAFRFPTPDPHR
jgi:hypothetical protein